MQKKYNGNVFTQCFHAGSGFHHASYILFNKTILPFNSGGSFFWGRNCFYVMNGANKADMAFFQIKTAI